MDEVAFAVQHDVAVVSVFDLQQEQQEAVGGHAADEVITSLQRERQDINDSLQEVITELGLMVRKVFQVSVHCD